MATTKEISIPAQTRVPDWEHEAQAHTTTKRPGFTTILTSRFNAFFSPHRTYLGLSRRVFLLILSAVFFLLLTLIIGLAVGLTLRSSSTRNLPLPGNAEIHTGDLTYYDTGLGACGLTSSASDNVVSISHFVFDAVQVGGNPNSNPLCGRRIRARRWHEGEKGERSLDLRVVDRCTGCQPQDIDVSYGAFDKLAVRDHGRVTVEWAWLES